MTDSVKGKGFCFTGAIKYTRDVIKQKLRARQARYVDKVQDANYLVVGTRPGKTKIREKYSWTTQITEDEFLVMLGEYDDVPVKAGDFNAIAAVQKDERIELFMNHMEEVLLSSTDLDKETISNLVARAEAKTILKLHREGKSNG